MFYNKIQQVFLKHSFDFEVTFLLSLLTNWHIESKKNCNKYFAHNNVNKHNTSFYVYSTRKYSLTKQRNKLKF